MSKSSNPVASNANTLGALCVESFLFENYRFRRNELSGKVEFASVTNGPDGQSAEVKESDYRPLTQEALNSMILRAKREEVVEKGNPRADIELIVHSEEIPLFNPVGQFLDGLPQWDGQNHVAQLFSRLPGLSSEHLAFLAIWLRSAVAHWLQMDTLHGNECVPVLVGPQGCGKTTFLRRLLPPELRQYYLDHLNLGNKFDKEMALTNNLLVNLDELEAIRPSQHAALKQTLSKSKVNGRPIFGKTQEDRKRFASFVATTNNSHPLTDATGSRRYICMTIPKGQLIDNTGDIDYEQLYAQVVYELKELKAPYWFNNDEVMRIQQLNQTYSQQKDLVQMVECCFRKPEDDEAVKALNTTELLKVISREYPDINPCHSTRIHLGMAMKELGFDYTNHAHVVYYKAIPLKVA